MSETIKILRNKKRSIDSADSNTNLPFEAVRTTAPIIDTDIKSTIDLNEQYMVERNSCDEYRLILTIKPYCTNILFNACTEVVRNEGSDSIDVVLPNDNIDSATLNEIKSKIKGKGSRTGDDVNIYDMIRNTEYSKESIGFEYHPGLDIFNNHILRNKTYRVVNDHTGNADTDVFNTIADIMRTSKGVELDRCCRKSAEDVSLQQKHLYDKDDILPFYTGEAITENLKEENGWVGFYNTSTITIKDRNGVDMDINRVINNKGNCEFIDMYPDRTLFSFVPKYNAARNRLEYNWDYVITYAFDSTTTYNEKVGNENAEKEFKVIQDNGVNALATITVEYKVLPNGQNAVFFRSATKHNLHPNDKVYIYFNEDEDSGLWHKSCHTYNVTGIGDINHKNSDYYFYVTDTNLLEEIFCTPYLCDVNIENANTDYGAWEYVRDYFYGVYNPTQIPEFSEDKEYKQGQLTRYNDIVYIAVEVHKGRWDLNDFDLFDDGYFVEYPPYNTEEKNGGLTNIPSEGDKFIIVDDVRYVLYNHDRDLVYDGSVDCEAFIRGIINNAFANNDEYTTNTEVNTSMTGLWSDYISIRFVKTNGVYNCSYYVRKFKQLTASDGGKLNQEQYPLAFSDTIYGDRVVQNVFTDNINVNDVNDNLGRKLSEVFLTIIKTNRGYKKWYGTAIDSSYNSNVYDDEDIEYSHCFGPVTCGFELSMTNNDTLNTRNIRKDFIDTTLININDDMSTIPSNYDVDGCNTDDITADDEWFYGDIVEFCPWTCSETPISDVCFRFNTAQREWGSDFTFKFDEINTDDYDTKGFKVCTYEVVNGVMRPEGYYYKAHYRIPLGELGPVQEASHPYLSVFSVTPVQLDGVYLMVTTNLKHHILTGNGDKILVRDTLSDNTPEWWLDVAYVVDDYTFIMKTISRDNDEYRDWVLLSKNIMDNKYTLRAENLSIPKNAVKLGVNTYVWRDTIKTWDLEASDSEYSKYVFANNALYVDKCFNFYLKRQDPYNTNGLYFDGSNCIIRCITDDSDCESMQALDKWFVGDNVGEGDKAESPYYYNEIQYEDLC